MLDHDSVKIIIIWWEYFKLLLLDGNMLNHNCVYK